MGSGLRTIIEVFVVVMLVTAFTGLVSDGVFEREAFGTFPTELLALYPEATVEVSSHEDTLLVEVSKADLVQLRLAFYQHDNISCLYAEILDNGSYVVVADGVYHEAEFLGAMKELSQE